VSVPDPIAPGTRVRLVADSGDTLFYGPTSPFSHDEGLRKSYSQVFELR